jgi:hypothetical protein
MRLSELTFASWRSIASTVTQLLLLLTTQANASPTCGSKEPKLGAVASESAVCSKIGTALIKEGGNAVDALVGTVFCIGVVGMYHSGIGGGGFMIVRSKNGTYEFIDFRETAPAAAFEDMYKNNIDASLYGGLARYVLKKSSSRTLGGFKSLTMAHTAVCRASYGVSNMSTSTTACCHGSESWSLPSRWHGMGSRSRPTSCDTWTR